MWTNQNLQEDTAVQRAKRALKAQLRLRGEAAGRAQALRDAGGEEEGDAAAAAAANAGADAGEEGGGNEGDDGARKAELQELDERVMTASKVGWETFFFFFFFLVFAVSASIKGVLRVGVDVGFLRLSRLSVSVHAAHPKSKWRVFRLRDRGSVPHGSFP